MPLQKYTYIPIPWNWNNFGGECRFASLQVRDPSHKSDAACSPLPCTFSWRPFTYKKGVDFREYCFGCFWISLVLCPVYYFMWAKKKSSCQVVGKASHATGVHGTVGLSGRVYVYVPFSSDHVYHVHLDQLITCVHCESGNNTGVCSPEWFPKKLSELLQPKVWLSFLLKDWEVFYSSGFCKMATTFSGCLMDVTV